ncbi:MAG: hypothetical protein KDI75_10000 [Xanthomonadales bacterium]|nr:hypothetical protein [Xanthomonadales bacterium]
MQRRRATHHIDLSADHDWSGWRVRGRYLVAPGGRKFTARELIGLSLMNDRYGTGRQRSSKVPSRRGCAVE